MSFYNIIDSHHNHDDLLCPFLDVFEKQIADSR